MLGNGDSKINGIWFRLFSSLSTVKTTCLHYGVMTEQGEGMRAEMRHFGGMEGKEGDEKELTRRNKNFKDRLNLIRSHGRSSNSMNKGQRN